MPQLIQQIPEGPIDIVGDVHGELDALVRLLHRLGCDPDKATAQRPLLFVGDLVDRGPDSVAVCRLVQRLERAGIAHVIVGNHELNILRLREKEGNGWILGHDDGFHVGDERRPFSSRAATDTERAELMRWFATFPVARVRSDLRIIHACWHQPHIDALPAHGVPGDLIDEADRAVRRDLRERGVLEEARRETLEFEMLTNVRRPPTRPLPARTELTLAEHTRNPVRGLTAGLEDAREFGKYRFITGKWRSTKRARWWESYHDEPAVVIGHYWRRRGAPIDGKPDPWGAIDPMEWAGPKRNVFCLDFSVGRRFRERAVNAGNRVGFDGALAALRWPERIVYFDDRDDPVPTVGFRRE